MPQPSESVPQGISVVLAIGDELLRGHTADTNTHWLAQRLYALGYPVDRAHTIADRRDEIIRWIQLELEEVHFEMAVEAEFWRVLRKVEQEFSDVSVGSYPQPDRGHLVIRVAGADAARVHAAAATVRAEGPGRLR